MHFDGNASKNANFQIKFHLTNFRDQIRAPKQYIQFSRLFSLQIFAADSIFTATELQLSKDPGFRASRPDTKGMFTL